MVSAFESFVDGIYAVNTSDLRALFSPEARAFIGSLTDASTNAPRHYMSDLLQLVKRVPIMGTDHISEIASSGDGAGDSYFIVSKGRGLAGSYGFAGVG